MLSNSSPHSPLGRGFLTGTIKSVNDLAGEYYALIISFSWTLTSVMTEGDLRRHHDRFQEEAFNHNMAIVNAMKVIAAKKGVTPGQLALAWVVSRGPHVMPIPGSSWVELSRWLSRVELTRIRR